MQQKWIIRIAMMQIPSAQNVMKASEFGTVLQDDVFNITKRKIQSPSSSSETQRNFM